MPLTYREVKDLHDAISSTETLPAFAARMNSATESDRFSAGLNDNWLKRTNVGINRIIESTGAPEVTGNFGEAVGGFFGMPEAGRQAGETIPRMALDTASFFIPGLGQANAWARLAPAMGMAGMGAYGDTGSVAAGLSSAAMMGVLPGATDAVEQWALRKLGAEGIGTVTAKAGTEFTKPVLSNAERYRPQNLFQGAGAYTAGQAGAMGLMGGSELLQQALDPNAEMSNPFTEEFWLSQGIQNLPFMAMHGAKKLTGKGYAESIVDARSGQVQAHDRDMNQRYADRVNEDLKRQGIIGATEEITPKAQARIDELTGKANEVTEADRAAADEWTSALQLAKDRMDQTVGDMEAAKEAQKNLRSVSEGIKSDLASGKLPFAAFLSDPTKAIDVEGEVTHVTQPGTSLEGKPLKGGAVFAWVNQPDGTRKYVQFSRGKYTGEHEVGQTKFKIPADSNYVTENPHQNEGYAKKVTAEVAREEAKKAQEVLQGTLPLTPEHDALRLRAEELDRVAHDATVAEVEAERKQRTEALQQVGTLVNDFMAEAGKAEKGEDVDIKGQLDRARQIEKLLTANGQPSMHDTKARRSGPLAGITAKNLGLVLDSKKALWLKSEHDKFKVSVARGKETDSATKSNVSLDAAKEKGDALEAEATKSQAEMDAIPDTDEVQAVYDNSPTNDGVLESLQHDAAVNVVKGLKERVGGMEPAEWGRVLHYLKEKAGMGEKFDLENDFINTLPDSWVDDSLSDFESRPHVVEARREFAKVLGGKAGLLPSKAARNPYAAGGTFVWGVNPDVVVPKFAKDGKVDVVWFQRNAGLSKDKTVAPVEIEMMRMLYPEVFRQNRSRKEAEKIALSWGRMGKDMADYAKNLEADIQKLMREQVETGQVDMSKLQEAMSDPDRQPVITAVYGQEGKVSEAKAELDKMTHEWFDVIGLQRQNELMGVSNVDQLLKYKWSPSEVENARVYRELDKQVREEPPSNLTATSYYNQISPWDTKKFPVVRVDVSLPPSEKTTGPTQSRIGMEGSAARNRESNVLWSPDNLHENLPNTLGWAMVQFVPGKDGKTVAFAAEVQSRWGQERQKEIARVKKEKGDLLQSGFGEEAAQHLAQDDKVTSHPLLEAQHVLVLKAVIAEAAKRGVDRVVLSDGETAMMTEGHDKRVATERNPSFVGEVNGNRPHEGSIEQLVKEAAKMGFDKTVVEDDKVFGWSSNPTPSQSGGMRLHYDTTLRSAMKKLTGEGGEVWDGGDHKNIHKDEMIEGRFSTQEQAQQWAEQKAIDDPQHQYKVEVNEDQSRTGDKKQNFVVRRQTGSPVFRNADGTPKSSVTGYSFDTTKAVSNLEANGGFTLGNRHMAKAQPWDPSPVQLQRVVDRKMNGSAHDLATWIASQPEGKVDTNDSAWATYLLKHMPEALQRVVTRFNEKGQTTLTPFNRERRGEIEFSPWNTKEGDASFARTALEELNHSVTASALSDPKNAKPRLELEALRQRVIEGLSKDERQAFDKLKRTKKLIIEGGSLHADPKTEDLIYSLRDVDEFTANGMTTHPLRERLAAMEKKKGWFSEFVKNVKSLFGIAETNSAYDEFLYHTGQIMTSQEAVAKSMNYLEAHFKMKGYAGDSATEAAVVASQFMNKHGVAKGDPQALFPFLMQPSDGDSNNLIQMRNASSKILDNPNGKEAGNTAMLFDNPKLNRAVEDWFFENLDTPATVSFYQGLPEATKSYIDNRVAHMQNILEGVNNLARAGSAPVTDLLAPKVLVKTTADMLEALKPFVAQQSVERLRVSQLRALDSFAPENMLAVMGSERLPAKVKGFTPDDMIDKPRGWLRTLVSQMGQWAQENPLVKEVLVRATDSERVARTFAQKVHREVLGYDPANPGVHNQKLQDEWTTWVEKEAHKDVVDTILRTNNVVGRDKVKLLAPDSPEMIAALKGKDTEIVAKAHKLVRQIAMGTQRVQDHILHRMAEDGALNGAKIVLLQSENVNVEAGVAAARQVLDAMLALKANPGDVVAGERLRNARAGLEPKVFEALLESQKRMSEVVIAAREHFKNNPGWVTIQRKGEFLYKGTRGGKEVLMGANNDKEVLWWAKKHGVQVELKSKRPNDHGDYAQMDWSQDFIDKALAYDDYQYKQLELTGASAEQLEQQRQTAVGAKILKDQHVNYDIGDGSTKGRTFSRGGDIVPFTDNFFSYLEGTPSYWNKRMTRTMMDTLLLAPEYRAAPETSKGLRQWLNGYLTPDPKFSQGLQRAVTTFTLGGNVGFLLNNVFQPFLRGITEMMSHGVSFLDAFKGVTGALKDAAKSFTQGQIKRGDLQDLSKGLKNADDRWFMERLDRDLITDRSLFDETEMQHNANRTNFTRSLNKSKPKTLGQYVASQGGALSNVMLGMVKHGERANTTATALGAFRALMKTFPEKGREWAEGKARDVNQATNDPGGRFNRAIGLYDNAGPASRSAAMMAGALQSYTFGTINQLIRHFEKGWKGSSLTPAEKFAGRKAFLTQLGLQFAVAGALGMPFVSGALALINQVDPSLEINKKVREAMRSLFAEDGKDGHPLTDMFMAGLPSQLGWDMQSRMSSGELIPGVSERDGFNANNLLGVPVSLATQMVGGVKQMAQGKASGLMAFVPPGLRSQIRLAAGTAGDDFKGRPVLTDMTPGENVGLALGMRPTRLREFNDAQRMSKQAEEQDNIRKGQQRQDWAGKVLKGDFGSVMGELKGKVAENPKMDVAGEVRQIAKYAEAQAFPRDLRREAKGDNRSELLRSWNLAPSQPTEEQRQQFRTRIEQQFGVRGQDGTALRQARMLDELRKQFPNATNSELRAKLQRVRVQPELAMPE